MWIDISNNIAFNSPNIQKKQKAIHKKSVSADQTRASVRQNYQSLIQHAVDTYQNASFHIKKTYPAIDIQALDTPENARLAAGNILKSGI